MDCNRDEALKAKEVAEKKFAEDDVAGAKKFALKAQSLFPALDGIDKLIRTLDVHLASQLEVCGEKDWYAILGLDASADEEALKKQYKRMALQLHPDKNRSVGAEGAFKLVLEAWQTLSDKATRMEYDQKIRSEQPENKVHQTDDDIPVHNDNDTRTHDFFSTFESKDKAPMPENTTPAADLFWTCCHRCEIEFQYPRKYVKYDVLCVNCRLPFVAVEVEGPRPGTETPWPTHEDLFGNQNNQWGTSPAARAANLIHEAYERARREEEEEEEEEAKHKHTNVPKRNFSASEWRTHPNHSSSTSTNTYPGENNMEFEFSYTGAPNTRPGNYADFFGNQNSQWGAFAGTAGATTSATSAAAQAANLVREAYQRAKREKEEAKHKHMNVPKSNFSASQGNNDAGSSSESLLRKKKKDSGGLTRDGTFSWFFTGNAKPSDVENVGEVSHEFSESKAGPELNLFGTEPVNNRSAMGAKNYEPQDLNKEYKFDDDVEGT